MALPILDGNQTAATLSTVLTGGEHIPAHTVVSLGSQAITDVRSAVSGSVVSISNFPASQGTTFGAVTGSVSVLNFPSTQTIAGTVTANVAEPAPGVNTFISESGSFSPAYAVGIGYNTANNAEFLAVNDSGNNFPVAVNNSVTIGSLPAISGTVTANVTGQVSVSNQPSEIIIKGYDFIDDEYEVLRTDQDGVLLVAPNGTIAVVGTVTANPTGTQAVAGTVTVSNQQTLISYSGQITATAGPAILARGEYSGTGWTTLRGVFTEMREDGAGIPIGLPSGVTSLGVSVGNSITIGSLPDISGTVTANNPNGALTTRFGSVTTANTAQITSAVTNTSRKYLLVQNISAGTVTIGIGFSPTTTQGIQLTAGAGLTFDSFCVTGAVYWLGAVTGAAFTILEG